MIVKFVHISYTCRIGEETAFRKAYSDYEEAFCEKKVPNLDVKMEFMKLNTREHDLYMMTKEGNYPIEITSYSECVEGKNRLRVNSDELVILSSDMEKTEAFYRALGFATGDAGMSIKPMLNQTEIKIRIEQETDLSHKTYLDQKGWGILAFVVDNAKKQKRLLETAGVRATDIQELTVNGKCLKIFFAESNVGDLVELIGIR